MREFTDLESLTREGEFGGSLEWGDPLAFFTGIGFPEITENTRLHTGTPLLSIYYTGTNPQVLVHGGTSIELIHNGESVLIQFESKSTSQLVGAINKLSFPYTANLMFEADDLVMAQPFIISLPTGSETVDGGIVVMGRAHVVKPLEETQIRILPPYNSTRYDPWYIVVNRGWVTRRFNGDDWKFSVPEYSRQTWSTSYGVGFIDIEDEIADRLGPQALGVSRAPIHWDRGNIQITVGETRQPASVIRDVDIYNGVIYLNKTFSDDDTILVDYTYKEDGYIYQGANMNPTEFHVPGVIERYVLFYLLPYANSNGILRNVCVTHTESSTLAGAIQSIPNTGEPVMLLGAAQVRQVHDSEEVDVTDTRTRGGGVVWDKFYKARSRNRDIMNTMDRGFYDGHPYPGNMALFVTLPDEIKDTLSKAEIDGTIKRFMEYGTYVFVEFD